MEDEEEGGKNQSIPTDEKNLLSKIDRHIIPASFVLYFVAYLDRINVGNVHDDLVSALGLKEWEFSFAVAIFFVGYILMEIPSNVALKKTRPSWWIGSLVFFFGLISAATIFVKSFVDLIIVRFFLGVAEAGLFPGLVFYLTNYWYKGSEYTSRIAYMYSASAVAGAVGGLIAYGVLRIDWWLDGWQWLFLIEGVASMIVGVVAFFFLPDRPEKSSWLSPDEKELATTRLQPSLEKTGSSTKEALILVLSSKRTWAFSFLYFCQVTVAYSLGFYLPTLLTEMGFDELGANLMTVPSYTLTTIAILVVSYFSDKTGDHGMFTFITTCVCGFAFVTLTFSANYEINTLSIISVMIANAGIQSSMPPILAWFSSTYKSKPTSERAVGTAFLISIGNLGGIVGPNLYGLTVKEEDGDDLLSTGVTESFVLGHLCMSVVIIVGSGSALILWITDHQEKRRGDGYVEIEKKRSSNMWLFGGSGLDHESLSKQQNSGGIIVSSDSVSD